MDGSRHLGARPLGQRALWHEVDVELAGEKLLLEDLVLAYVRGDRLADLAVGDEESAAEVVDAAVDSRGPRSGPDAVQEEGHEPVGNFVRAQTPAGGEPECGVVDHPEQCERTQLRVGDRELAALDALAKDPDQ